ncbi:hypothetical protein [Geobacter argillaceus]|uniref:hypothetical protein n=1 Tax=Geobacter argillaceus TaxID=345631 RepID=UPI0011A5D107|nr:hypothetical protein [Geobacter argillaceus]
MTLANFTRDALFLSTDPVRDKLDMDKHDFSRVGATSANMQLYLKEITANEVFSGAYQVAVPLAHLAQPRNAAVFQQVTKQQIFGMSYATPLF